MHFLPLSSCLGIAITVYFSFAGKRIPRTESGLVGGNCAGKHAHKAKSWSGAGEECRSDQELEKSGSTKMRSTGAVKAWMERPALFFTDYEHMLIQLYFLRFLGLQNGPKTPRNVSQGLYIY